MPKRQTLAEWIDECMTEGLTGVKPGQVTSFSLMHMVGVVEKEVHSIVFNGTKQWTAQELSDVFNHKANSFAQDLPGAQTFCMAACFEGETNPLARHPFVVAPQSTDFGSLTTEQPTDKGIVQQSMRHLEVRHTQADRIQTHAIDSLLEMNRMTTSENRDLRREVMDAFKGMREMFLARLTEEHEMKMKEVKAQREQEMLTKLLEYAPVLLNSLTGKEVIPQPKVDSILIDTLAKNATPELVDALSKSLPPEVVGAFMGRVQQAAQLRANAEEAAAKALMEHAEDDAAGGKD
jgi:hypothetical protein